MESSLIKFYKNVAPDQSGRLITDLWKMDFSQLEYHHDYIQWLFPLPEKSMHNWHAPILSEKDIISFKEEVDLQQNVYRSFNMMINFYGFELTKDSEGYTIKKRTGFKDRTTNWLTPGNHNFLRISRIIRFLTLIDQYSLVKPFYEALEILYKDHSSIIGNSFQYWTRAMNEGFRDGK